MFQCAAFDSRQATASGGNLAAMSEFVLNDKTQAMGDCDPTESLLRWLKRNRVTGTKEGCADGDCGACTVALLGANGRLQAVNSCLLPMGFLPGRSVRTVEGLADGQRLHPVQQALIDCAGSQCGYCTPGFVMSLFVGLNEGELSDHTIEGNLCRCTGYRPIREAITQLREIPAPTASAQPLVLEAAQLGQFFSPLTVRAALELKAAHVDSQWIAGATDLGVALSHGKRVSRTLIALDRVANLQSLEVTPERVRIGAGVSLTRLERELSLVFPALDQMISWFAARQVRNLATLGGNLGSASPIGDLLPVLLALDARIELQSIEGVRSVSADTFFLDYRKTARREDELITSVEIPRLPNLFSRSLKIAKRQTDDISIVAACFAIRLDDERRISHARLAFGGVAATPLRALAAEKLLLGAPLDEITITKVADCLRNCFTPLSDHRASAAYRAALCGGLFEQFIDGLER